MSGDLSVSESERNERPGAIARAGGFRRLAVICALGATSAAGDATADVVRWRELDPATLQYETVHVAGTVHQVRIKDSALTSAAVSIGDDGVLVVDSSLLALADKFQATIRKLDGGPIRFVINTHYHGDHTGGNEALAPEATVLAHENTRKRLSTVTILDLVGREGATRLLAPNGLPVVTFTHPVTLHFNGEEVLLIPLAPGHTDGDLAVYFSRSNVLVTGDHFLADSFPSNDYLRGGDLDGFLRNLRHSLVSYPPDAAVIPGHGPVATMRDLAAWHDMVWRTVDYVRERFDVGETLAEIQAEGLPERYRKYDGKYNDEAGWIAEIYGHLSRTRARRP